VSAFSVASLATTFILPAGSANAAQDALPLFNRAGRRGAGGSLGALAGHSGSEEDEQGTPLLFQLSELPPDDGRVELLDQRGRVCSAHDGESIAKGTGDVPDLQRT
jgi:hypothetical protein